MSISKLLLPAAGGVAFNSGEVDYYIITDPVYFEIDNRPLKNLAWRDKVVADKVDELIDSLSSIGGTYGIANWLRPHPQTIPDDTLQIEAGRYISSTGKDLIEKAVPFNSSVFPVVTAAGLVRYDLVYMDDLGSSQILSGSEVAAPGNPITDSPDIPIGGLLVSIVRIDEDVTVVIDAADVTDAREFLNQGASGVSLVSGVDTTAKYLSNKISAGAGISLNVLNPGADESLEISAPGSTSDELAKVSVNDTTSDYLLSKIVAGTNITVTEVNDGLAETLRIDATGVATDVLVKATAADTTAGYLLNKIQAGNNVTFTVINPGANETIKFDAGGISNGLQILPSEITNFKPDDVSPITNVTLWGVDSAIRFNPDQDRSTWFSFNKSDVFPALTDIIFQLAFSLTTTPVAGDICRFILDYWIIQDGQTPVLGTPTNTLTEDILLTGIVGNRLDYIKPLTTLKILQAHIPSAVPARITCRLTRDVVAPIQNYANAFDIVSLVPSI